MFAKRAKSKPPEPWEVEALKSSYHFYEGSLDLSLGHTLGKKLGQNDEEYPFGIARWQDHVQPAEGDFKNGRNGAVCVIKDGRDADGFENPGNPKDYEEFKTTLISRYEKASETGKRLFTTLQDKNATDAMKLSAKEAFDRAHQEVDKLYDMLKESKSHGQVACIRVRVNDHGHHGTRPENWLKFTMKFLNMAGENKEVSIATFDGVRSFEDLISNNNREGLDRQYSSLCKAAEPFMPADKKRGVA